MKSITGEKKIFPYLLSLGLLLLPLTVGAVTLDDPLGLPKGDTALPTLAGRFIQAALGISGVLALIAFIYGGILYLLSGVSPDYVKKGKEIMKYAVIGLFVIFSSYAVINFFLRNVLVVPENATATERPTLDGFAGMVERE